jgi:hypothetical protein
MMVEVDIKRLLWILGTGALCFVLGFMVASRVLQPAIGADPGGVVSRVDTSAQLAVMKAQAQTCQQKFQSETILYEPGEPLTVPIFHGAVNIQAGSALHLPESTVPHWVIPALVTPRSLGPSDGMYYTQIDGHTQLISGPYAVAQLQPGERYNVNGWLPSQ